MTSSLVNRVSSCAAVLLASTLLFPGAAGAQSADTISVPDTTEVPDTVVTRNNGAVDTTADFTGKVASAATGKPISGARVSIPEIQYGAITDEEGKFTLRGLPPGLYDVRVHYLGYSSNVRPIRFRSARVTNATFLLERDVLEVADLTVEVKQTNRVDPMDGFRRRMDAGFGDFITRKEIEKRSPQHTSDLLRTVPGLNVGPTRYGRAKITMRCTGRNMRPAVYLDGVLVHDFAIDNIEPQAIEGIEVYRRASETPSQFLSGSPGCGVLVIHTRVGVDNSRGR